MEFCDVLGFRSGVIEVLFIIVNGAVSLGDWYLTFRSNSVLEISSDTYQNGDKCVCFFFFETYYDSSMKRQ